MIGQCKTIVIGCDDRMNKQEVLNGALLLNGEDQEYVITVDESRIITTVKWMDAAFFSPECVTDEVKTFKFTVTLRDDGTWTELDESRSMQVKADKRGVGMNYSSFKGTQMSFDFSVGLGKNRNDGADGAIRTVFCSETYKKPVREYLKRCGWKKAGFFARLFK